MAVFILRHKNYAPYRQHLSQQLQLRKDRLQDVIRIGLPASLQHGMEAAAFAFSGIMAGWLGYVQQAAHQIALNLAAITFMVSMGISAAGGIRVAYAFGQKNRGQVRKVGVSTFRMAIAYGLFCALLFTLGRHHLPLFFNDEAPVLAYAATLLLLAALFQVSDSVQAVGVGVLRGIQDVRIPTYFVALAYWGIGIPLGYFLGFILGWEVTGLWLGLVSGLTASALLLSFRFSRLTAQKENLFGGTAN
jgi:MATE family multidrug resistance protein